VAASLRPPTRGQARGFDYTVAHFGKLLPANSGGGGDALRLGVGDALSAGTPLAVAAEALARVLSGAVPSARNASFSLEGGSEATLRDEPRWADEFLKLSGPELARLPLGAAADRRATLSWLHDFGASFKKAPNTLPTPVRIDTLDDGTHVRGPCRARVARACGRAARARLRGGHLDTRANERGCADSPRAFYAVAPRRLSAAPSHFARGSPAPASACRARCRWAQASSLCF
jgi:hypothetical protein